ncbi:MAG: hypothetical protein GY822_22585 [Deltaproteobacteria bacterium]|nr:hypothetical protein [Deltaproteobacteria bacterium]
MKSAFAIRFGLMMVLFLAGGLQLGCASIGQSMGSRRELPLPDKKKLYIAPFVDFTEASGGVTLMVALQNEVYQASPAQYAFTFDENALIVDGTVVKFSDEVEGTTHLLSAELKAELRTFEGATAKDLGRVQVSASYDEHRDPLRAKRRRQRAKEQMWMDAAQQFLGHF